jgi:hypothetical protein
MRPRYDFGCQAVKIIGRRVIPQVRCRTEHANSRDRSQGNFQRCELKGETGVTTEHSILEIGLSIPKAGPPREALRSSPVKRMATVG